MTWIQRIISLRNYIVNCTSLQITVHKENRNKEREKSVLNGFFRPFDIIHLQKKIISLFHTFSIPRDYFYIVPIDFW